MTNPETDRTDAARRVAARVLPLIDLTSLGEDDDTATVDRLCAQATTPHGAVAAVCVWSTFVGRAVEQLAATGIPVAGVANFPAGGSAVPPAVADARRILDAGGREVDVVYPWRALAAGDRSAGPRLVEAVRDAVGPDTVVKVILETGELVEPALIEAAAIDAVAAGADFLKTSTGKTPVGATIDAAATLLDVIDRPGQGGGRRVGLKVSGGVRTVDDAATYLRLVDARLGSQVVSPATLRIGASGLLADVLAHLAP